MSKMIYVKTTEPRAENVVVTKSLMTDHKTFIFTTVIIIAISLLIGVGFVYMGYTSGHYSKAYVLCKDDVLAHERIGAYESVAEIMAALKSCGVIS